MLNRDAAIALTSRDLERRSLLGATLVGALGLSAVHLSVYRGAPWTPVLAGTAALFSFLIPHVVLARWGRRADELLLPPAAVLTSVSLVMLYRLSPTYLLRQSAWVALGLAVLLVALPTMSNLRWARRYRYLCGATALLLLALTIAVGEERNGARLWISLGGITVEPGEVVKLLLVGFFAGTLAEARQLLEAGGSRLWRLELAHLGPMLTACAGALVLLVLQHSLGLAALYYGIFLMMLYVATGRWDHLTIGALAFAAGATVCYFLFPYVRVRIDLWLNPWADAAGRGYQIVQALYGLGTGGVLGTGLGAGHPRFVPEAHTDMILATVGEELGFAGASCVIVLYLLLLGRMFRTAIRTSEDLPRFIATGLAVSLTLEAAIILAGSTRFTPLTGVPAPFLSYGGSATVSNFVAVALLLGISARRPTGGIVRTEHDVRRLTRLGTVLTVFFVALWGYLAVVQVVWGPRLAGASDNPRLALAAERAHWGRILDRRHRVLADSTSREGRQARHYPAGPDFAHILGYRSLRYGITGIEARFNAFLVGVPVHDAWDAFLEALGRPPEGSDVVLTIDADVQRAATAALGNRRGAVVVLDPTTGAVMAVASRPTFDPAAVDAEWSRLTSDREAPLLNRATQGQYPPGSAFKMVTLAAGLASGRVGDETVFECPGEIVVQGATIFDFNHTSHGRIALPQAFALSCNVSFVQIGLRTGAESLMGMARALGLGRAPVFDLPAAAGQLPDPRQLGLRGLAQISFGQGSLLVTPLQMALVAATIANGGMTVEPFVAAQVRTASGRVVVSHRMPRPHQVLPRPLAAKLAQYMLGVVQHGTGAAAQITGVAVAGKTGTAENPHGQTHAWFVGFAPVAQPTVTVAVILENAGVGGEVAAPVAREVLRAALAARGAK